MASTVDPMETRRVDPARAGAVWVTATGSFLLFAAAVVLVAVRWDSIPDGAKLGALGALSAACLLVGRPEGSAVARRVPAAASVLFHLGAFLTPVTAAAVLVHLEVPADVQLLALGAGSAALFHVLDRVDRSVVLRWATLAATVVATVGLGSLTPVPATAWLVALAAGAFLLREHLAAVAVATLATVAPLGALVLEQTDVRPLDAVVGTGLVPGAVGLATAAVLVGLTHRLRSLPLLALAVTALGTGVAATAAQVEADAVTWWLAAAAAFALLEVVALLRRDDPFWAKPLDSAGIAAEALALLAAPAGLLVTLALVVGFDADPLAGAVFGLVAVGWFLADLRRHEGDTSPGLDLLVGGNDPLANVALTGSLLGAVALTTASAPVAAVTAAVLAGLLVVSARPAGPGLVPALVLTNLWLVDGWPPAAVAGALLLAAQATLHRRAVAEWLAMAALVPAAIAVVEVHAAHDMRFALVTGLLVAAALAAVLDRSRAGDDLGWVPRIGATALLLGLVDQGAATIAVVTGTYVALATLDAHRRRDPLPLLGWAVGLPPLAASVAVLAGLPLAEAGLVLSLLAVPLAVAGHLRPAVRLPLLATSASLATTGVGLASVQPGVLATVLVLDGVVVLAAGLFLRQSALTAVGGVLACVGTWQHLDLQGVEAVDAYALPVAVVLWLVGTRLADPSASSWITHAPAVALAGGTALAERIDGGSGEHALLAGLVGLLAVVEGGGRRLAAPLLLGTGLLVGLTVFETTAVTAGVPTWAWLATGGTLLVGAGLAMERHELGPVETGRRLVDVVQERFR